MVKKTIISAITAIICVALICGSVSSGVKTYSNAMKEAAANAAAGSSSDEGGLDEVGLDEQGDMEDVPDVVLPGMTPEAGTEDGAEGGAEGNTEGGTEGGAAGGAASGSQQAAPQKPANGIHTLKYYNAVIDKAVKGKVGYQKTRLTDGEKMEGSSALQATKDLVYKFMGIGAENVYTESVEKGKWGDVAFLTNSKLTQNDVKSATCEENGSNYVIKLELKNGDSLANEAKHSLPADKPLDKCGICVGAEDKGYYDHKTGSVIYDAIDELYPTAEIKESYTKATVVATVDPATGNLISLVVEWNESVTLGNLPFGMSATASGVCHVTYENFKY